MLHGNFDFALLI